MSYIEFEKTQLINLEFSLNREILRSNRAGSFSCTTIIGCNTRKYHGLLIVPQPTIDDGKHVLLSSLDETIIQHDAEFNLAIHKYKDVYYPKGHKYIEKLTIESIPTTTYRVGGVLLTKEMLFVQEEDRILIKYTLVDAHSYTRLRLRPLLAFRNVHSLSKANVYVDTNYEEVKNGIKCRMYVGYTPLIMQFSKENEFVAVPDWYYNFHYMKEEQRGYEYLEDLYTPGFFELDIKKGESIIFSAGTVETEPDSLKRLFAKEEKKRIPRINFENNLINSAQQFIVRRNKKVEIIAGYPWFGKWGRDTFIALPGLTFCTGDYKTCKTVIDSMIDDLEGPLFPNVGGGNNASYNSVDTSLWFFWALQQYAEYTNSKKRIWKEYGDKMKLILNGYRNGCKFNIKMHDNGLIYAGEMGKALTWMDAIVNGKPVTPRIGYAVEVNALWYNAIEFSLEVASYANDVKFIKEWQSLPELIRESYKNVFWSKEKGYLADYVNGEYKDWSIRPNMVIATAMKYSPISIQLSKLVLDVAKAELLTPRGLRSLSPKDPNYKGCYGGDQISRDMAYHQGTVWPWLSGFFAEGYLRVHGESGLPLVLNMYKHFEGALIEHGIGTISEVYDGDPPHKPGGAISQAWSVGEILRMRCLIEKFMKNKEI